MPTAWRPLSLILGFVLALLASLPQSQHAAASFFEAWLAPDAILWPRWQTHDAASTTQPDHSLWDQWLEANVSTDAQGLARIPYAKVTPANRMVAYPYAKNTVSIMDIDMAAALLVP